jgi:uncharacterized membrane protein AbrB (regulator of aidB expression)
VPLGKHPAHPTSRASFASAVLGIALIATAVAGIAPVALHWPAWWPAVPFLVIAASLGVQLIRRHMARHRA